MRACEFKHLNIKSVISEQSYSLLSRQTHITALNRTIVCAAATHKQIQNATRAKQKEKKTRNNNNRMITGRQALLSMFATVCVENTWFMSYV